METAEFGGSQKLSYRSSKGLKSKEEIIVELQNKEQPSPVKEELDAEKEVISPQNLAIISQ